MIIGKIDSSPNIVLAIAPGTREFGVAVFCRFELIYFSVKTLNPKYNLLNQISEILQNLFQSFPPQIIAIKAINQYQKLANDLEGVVNQIKFEAKQKDIKVIGVTPEQIKNELCNGEKATQKKAFESLLNEYPELERFWNRPNKWQNDYYAFLFSAVAVGAVFLKKHSQM